MTRGILASVFASAIFGILDYIVTLMKPLTAEEIFAARMVLSGQMVRVAITLVRERPQLALARLTGYGVLPTRCQRTVSTNTCSAWAGCMRAIRGSLPTTVGDQAFRW